MFSLVAGHSRPPLWRNDDGPQSSPRDHRPHSFSTAGWRGAVAQAVDGQDAAYIDHWIRFLTDHEGAIVAAASAASKATNFLRGLAIAEPELEAA